MYDEPDVDPNKFLDVATSAQNWFRRSKSLRKSAELVWDKATGMVQDLSTLDVPKKIARTVELLGYLQTAQLLYSLALETALKGRIIRDNPNQIEFVVEMDGEKQLTSVKLKKLGPKMDDGHNIVRLAEEAGLLQSGGDAEARRFLKYVSECVSVAFVASLAGW